MTYFNISTTINVDFVYDEKIHDIPSATKEAIEQVVYEALSNAKFNGEVNGVKINSIECPQFSNLLCVPDLRPMYEATVNYVKLHQGKKGYVDLQNPDKSMVLALIYIDEEFEARERRVHAVRVNPNNSDLEILVDKDVKGYEGNKPLIFTRKDIKAKESEWIPVTDENVYFEHTLFKITENIREHVGI